MKSLKAALRKTIRRAIGSLSIEDMRTRSRLIMDSLVALPEWTDAGVILSFMSIPGEVDTEPIMTRALEHGKEIALPRMNGDDLVFHFIEDLSCDWTTGRWGIREPHPSMPPFDPVEPTEKKVLALVPGAAYDRNCFRLGWGRGFYDRFLEKAGTRVTTAGICFSVQLVEAVPAELHDRPTDLLVTDEAVFRRPASA